MVRVTAGVEAHTHEYIATAHEDQKFGFSITGGDAWRGRTPRARRAGARAARPALPHRLARSSTRPGSRWPPAGCWRCTPRISDEHGVDLPELDLGGGFGIAYTTQDDPADPAQLATEMTKIVEHECRALGIAVPRLSIEPGRAIVGPAMCTLYEVGTVKPVALDGGAVRTYVSRRRRHERQHPHRALRRRLLLHPGLARDRRRRRCWPASSASTARAATSW